MTCCRTFLFSPYYFILFAPLFPSPLALCRYIFLLFFVLFLSVHQQLFSRCVLFSPCKGYLLLFITYVVLFPALFLSDLASHSSQLTNTPTWVVCFLFLLFCFFFSLFYGLACCFVLFSYPVRWDFTCFKFTLIKCDYRV